MLDTTDFSTNPAASELGRFGMLSVRWGKAMRGSPPRRRNVATVMPWAVEAVQEYLDDVRPLYGAGATGALWLTERGSRISAAYQRAFRRLPRRDGPAAELTPHCLRHSYVSHLVEDGVDPLFVQQQVGHSWASTTAVYTSVSSDYKNKVLRQALARAFDEESQ